MAEVFALGGSEHPRFFAPAEQTTVRQDGWIMVQLEEAGILKLAQGGALALSNEDSARAVMVQAIRSGAYSKILAGLLVESDVKWTPAAAEKNAEFFEELTDPAEKETLTASFVGMLAGFFTIAARRSMRFPNVLSEHGAANAEAPAGSPSSTEANTVARDAPPSTDAAAASGPTPPDGSPTATPTT